MPQPREQIFRRRILVVEDDREIRLAWVAALEEAGYEVADAKDGRSGHARFLEVKPDLAVLDLRMPDIDGSELCRLIREESDVPVIILSAIGDEQEKIKAFEAGADDYLVKGVTVDELLARVSGQLRWNRRRRASDEQLPVLRVSERFDGAGARVVAKSGLTVLLADSDVAERSRLKKIVERNGHLTLEADTGDEALAIAEFKRPDVMIMDMHMPGLSGQKILLALRRQDLLRQIAVIVATKTGTPKDRAMARTVGAADYVVKPWSGKEVELRVGLALNYVRLQHERLEQAKQRWVARSAAEDSALEKDDARSA